MSRSCFALDRVTLCSLCNLASTDSHDDVSQVAAYQIRHVLVEHKPCHHRVRFLAVNDSKWGNQLLTFVLGVACDDGACTAVYVGQVQSLAGG